MLPQSLRYFLALCEEQNFGRAAKRCGVSQPTITNAIRRLERQLGGSLFVRKPKTLLTELALILKPYVNQILLDVRRAKAAATQALANGKPSKIGGLPVSAAD